jgi:thiol:disulfide interchange protein DsbD
MMLPRALALLISVLAPLTLAEAAPVRDQHVEVELVSDVAAIVPGQTLTVALRINHDDHWHTYWKNPGDAGLQTELIWKLPDGFSAGPIRWQLLTPNRNPFLLQLRLLPGAPLYRFPACIFDHRIEIL